MTHPLDRFNNTPPWAGNERHNLWHGKDQWSYLTTFLSDTAVTDLGALTLNGWHVIIRGHANSVLIRITRKDDQ